MAVIWVDGFEQYASSQTDFSSVATGPYIDVQNGISVDVECGIDMPNGGVGKGLRLTQVDTLGNPAVLMGQNLSTSVASGGTIGIGFNFNITSITLAASDTNSYGIVRLEDGTTDGPTLICTTSKKLGINLGSYTGNSFDVPLGDALNEDQIYHIEVKYYLHATEGTAEIRVDGETYSSATGLNTLQSMTAVDKLEWGLKPESGSGVTFQHFIDDLYIWDNTGSENNNWMGIRYVDTLFPSADTADEDWTRSSGTDSFDLINNVPPDEDNDNLTSSTTGDVSIFDMENLSNANYVPAAVMLGALVEKDTAGDGTFEMGLKSGSTEDNVEKDPVVTNSDYVTEVFNTDPDGNAWTATTVNALQTLIRRKA